eukprot:m.833455 g.833455  ORF g.833455 m.833455 type:complete len:279 (-) comp23442_c0_seq20:1985-2821(-)
MGIYQVYFGMCVVGFLLTLRIGTSIISNYASLTGVPKKQAQNWCCVFARRCLSVLFAFNPWIRIVTADGKPLKWPKKKDGEPAPFFVMNHTSFLDFFVFSAMCPPDVYENFSLRTMIKGDLFQMPLYGPAVGRDCGSFPVHFTGSKHGDFKVDKSLQMEVMAKIDDHVTGGGSLAICPEGQISKDPPSLQSFRRGSFALPIKHKMPIWGLTMLGCHESWPKKSTMGGLPATITITLEHLYTPTGADDETPADVAQKCEDNMRKTVDKLISDLGSKKSQ